MKLLLILFSTIALTKGATKCYGELGCFSDGAPFWNFPRRLVSVTPQSPDHIRTGFRLYTRENLDTPQILDVRKTDNISKTWTHFKHRNTKIVIHGFYDDVSKDFWMATMAKELLKIEDVNAIVVDWHRGNGMPYTQATANTRVVGAQVAVLIQALIAQYGVTARSFHLIGHSLGAHISGYAGDRVSGIGRISGLDPAGPYFSGTDKVVRLDPGDAEFVDVIHTDANFLHGLGIRQPVGHVDFYPNGGHHQPGCPKSPVDNILDTFGGSVQQYFVCSHHRAFHYYTASIRASCEAFKAYPCRSEDDFNSGRCDTCPRGQCLTMGYHAVKLPGLTDGNTEQFYLKTKAEEPFC